MPNSIECSNSNTLIHLIFALFRAFNFRAEPFRANLIFAEMQKIWNFRANNGERIIRNKAIIIFDSSSNKFSSKDNFFYIIYKKESLSMSY